MAATIFALSTPPGKSGVAVIRISGDRVREVMKQILVNPVPPRRAVLRKIIHPVSRETIDSTLVLFFAGPASFTGEDTLELHLHGGAANIAHMLSVLENMKGVRQAQPGEFSRRAFDNEKIDLTELEGLADLIEAETEAQRRSAVLQAQGHHRSLYEGWRKQIIESLSLMTAAIDFSDEGDIAEEIEQAAIHKLEEIQHSIQQHLSLALHGEIIRNGFRIALVGAPNAGKSSLLNWLARRDVAIVSHQPGTTRDVLEIHLDLAGYKTIFADTAGIRKTQDDVEQEGIRRSWFKVREAQLVLWLVDGSQSGPVSIPEELQKLEHVICLITKQDLPQKQDRSTLPASARFISVQTGQGMNELIQCLEQEISSRFPLLDEPVLTHGRYRKELETALVHLGNSVPLISTDVELAAEEINLAARHLGRLTGSVDVEDLLDHIFSQFCIGK